MKILRHKSLMNLIYAVMLSLPILSIAARVLYTQWNKNAKDSYSGETTYEINYKYQSNEVTSNDDLIYGNIYRFTCNDLYQPVNEIYFQLTILKFYDLDLTNCDIDENYYPALSGIGQNYVGLLDGNNINLPYLGSQADDNYTSFIIGQHTKIDCICIFEDSSFDEDFLYTYFHYTDYNEIESVNIDTSGTLDNAFEYSINKIIDNNLGQVQFFTTFADLFLDLDNQQTSLYVNFVNWYFNYTLLVSCAYLLFAILMWFINLARKMLTKGLDYSDRGY